MRGHARWRSPALTGFAFPPFSPCCSWLFPGRPRWTAAPKPLKRPVALLYQVSANGFVGSDPNSLDPARVLRLVGTVNTKNGMTARLSTVYRDDYLDAVFKL